MKKILVSSTIIAVVLVVATLFFLKSDISLTGNLILESTNPLSEQIDEEEQTNQYMEKPQANFGSLGMNASEEVQPPTEEMFENAPEPEEDIPQPTFNEGILPIE